MVIYGDSFLYVMLHIKESPQLALPGLNYVTGDSGGLRSRPGPPAPSAPPGVCPHSSLKDQAFLPHIYPAHGTGSTSVERIL